MSTGPTPEELDKLPNDTLLGFRLSGRERRAYKTHSVNPGNLVWRTSNGGVFGSGWIVSCADPGSIRAVAVPPAAMLSDEAIFDASEVITSRTWTRYPDDLIRDVVSVAIAHGMGATREPRLFVPIEGKSIRITPLNNPAQENE